MSLRIFPAHFSGNPLIFRITYLGYWPDPRCGDNLSRQQRVLYERRSLDFGVKLRFSGIKGMRE